MWDLVLTDSQTKCKYSILFSKEMKEDQTAVSIVLQIIKKCVNNQIIFNIVNLKAPKKI